MYLYIGRGCKYGFNIFSHETWSSISNKNETQWKTKIIETLTLLGTDFKTGVDGYLSERTPSLGSTCGVLELSSVAL